MHQDRWEPAPSAGSSLSRLLGWAGFVFLCCMALLLVGTAQWSRAQHLGDAREAARGMARLVSSEIGRRLDITDVVLASVADLARQTDRDDASATVELRRRLQELMLQLPDAADLRVVDAAGRIWASARHPEPGDVSFADRDYFQTLREHAEGMVVGQVDNGRLDDAPMLSLARRIDGRAGMFRGVAVAVFRVERLSRLFQPASSPLSFTLAVHAPDGSQLVRHPLAMPGEAEVLPWSVLNAGSSADEGTVIEGEGNDGRLWAFSRIGRDGLLATASLPVAQVMADWRRDLLPSLLFGVVALAGMTVLGVVAMRRAWAEQAGQVRLLKASQALEHTLDEKDTLLAELHHRVKNNMQVIVTLLQMEQARQGDSEARRRFEALSGRIVLMGRIHERLYASESFARLDLLEHLQEHCADQAKAYPQALVTVTGQTVWCGFDTALPLALIVHELVDNALRGGGTAPEIQVRLAQAADGLTIVVSAKRGGWVGQQEGLGRVLIQALAAQIGAEVEEHGEDGTAVALTLPPERMD